MSVESFIPGATAVGLAFKDGTILVLKKGSHMVDFLSAGLARNSSRSTVPPEQHVLG